MESALRQMLDSLYFVNLGAGLGIGIGLAACFAGYRLFRLVLSVIGFGLVAPPVGMMAYVISDQPIIGIIAAVLGGALGAAFLLSFYFVGIFLLGAGMAGAVGYMLLDAMGRAGLLGVLLLGIAGGVAALFLQKAVIILSTAFGGAWMVVSGVGHFLVGPVSIFAAEDAVRVQGAPSYALFGVWLVLGAVGALGQYWTGPP